MSETEITEARGRAEARMGLEAPDSLVEEAVKLTEQKIQVKGLPEDYAPLPGRISLRLEGGAG